MYFFVPETKDKTLEELDIYFGGDDSTVAAADRERMERINIRLGLAGVNEVSQLAEKPVAESAETT